MQLLKFGLIFLAALVVYVGAILAGFNLPGAALLKKSIAGNEVLKVTVLMDNRVQDPVANVEVDVAETPGPPPEGGVSPTDSKGVATFHIKPGTYVIYFNNANFPKNLAVPELVPVTVTQGEVAQVTIQVSTAK
jgi:hypothetical protein